MDSGERTRLRVLVAAPRRNELFPTAPNSLSRAVSRPGLACKFAMAGRHRQHARARALPRELPEPHMTWVRANYDRVSVFAAALFLFVSALLISKSAWQFGDNLGLQSAPPPKPA